MNVVCPVRCASVLTLQTIQVVTRPVKILLAVTGVLAPADIVWPSMENALVSLLKILYSHVHHQEVSVTDKGHVLRK